MHCGCGWFGDSLKARRAELTPHQVGLPDTGAHRKVAGLRREEVAQLAAISVDYLTRLEQGRVHAAASVLVTLTKTLRLDDDQQAYLYELAGRALVRPRRRPAQRVHPAMQRLLDQLTDTPAMTLGRRMDVLAWNAGATALFTDLGRIPAGRRNYVRLLFTDPAMRGLRLDWGDQWSSFLRPAFAHHQGPVSRTNTPDERVSAGVAGVWEQLSRRRRLGA